jgi:glucosamine-6-phosphate deaminase
MPCYVFANNQDLARYVADQVAGVIRARNAAGQAAVLGLPTGSTPVGVYRELIRMCQEEGLDFSRVVTFNLDEYYGLAADRLQSYRRWMHENFFKHVNVAAENIHIPDGSIPPEEIEAHCRDYEAAIGAAGGIDLQLLGIGANGHIGFNEPFSGRTSRTRLATLDPLTRSSAASDFFSEENVPTQAITMGVGTILEARRIILMALGEAKAPVVARSVEGPVSPSVAASFLQEHPNAAFYLDAAAAAELTRAKSPWLLGEVAWSDALVRKAVIWLARAVEKPILKLTDEDYNENHLQDLLAEHGPGYEINVRVFREMQRTITGWPAGKPIGARRAGDVPRPGDDGSAKRVVVFSPHPDDDVISMGGTLIRLVEQGHEVHVAYQTSGNIAVFDDDARRFAEFAADFNRLFRIDEGETVRLEEHVERFLIRKRPGQVDSPEVQKIKSAIRRGEARAAGRSCGLPAERLHFLDLPFYETGRVRKRPLGAEDIELVASLLHRIRPHQIYAAGDLSDPHGTHRTCLAALIAAIERVRAEAWFAPCEVWLYRGAWQEWEPERIEMAVPLSPAELERKIEAIFKHQSQKDKALFPGADEREFWQRAEQRNRTTARLYDALGLAEYEAIEAFVRWNGRPVD